MKILHTSDWHLGHRLHEQSQFQEQLLFLKWLENYIEQNKIDILLIAGDIFDTGVPSTQSQKMYYDFLINLTKTCCKHIVIIGGNHDAPGTINAPKELLSALSINVVGKSTEDVKNEVFLLPVKNETAIIAAVPYLRDQDIRRAIAGETFEEVGDRYKNALINHYTKIAEYCKKINEANYPIIAMGHLFCIGGSTSDSERSIYVGNLGDIGANDFSDIFDYIALGHLHRPQKVGGKKHIRYSGSPYILSFSEINYDKNIVVIETKNNKIINIEDVIIPKFRKIFRITGTIDDCITQLIKEDEKQYDLTPWVELIIDNSKEKISFSEINRIAENLSIGVLKKTLKNKKEVLGLEQLVKNSKSIKELSPIEVFKMKCKEEDFDLNKNVEILDAFNEILQIVREN